MEDGIGGESYIIRGSTPKTNNVDTSLLGPTILLTALNAIYSIVLGGVPGISVFIISYIRRNNT
jgi:hypothetical protein